VDQVGGFADPVGTARYLVQAPHAGGHSGEGAELVDGQRPLWERAGPGGPPADGDADPRSVSEVHSIESVSRAHVTDVAICPKAAVESHIL
jgi:hypothetical protein